jgi:predicted TIM-barrel fold metal-dependent hydrolase
MQTPAVGQPSAAKRSKLKRSIVDCDIHHYTGHDVIKPYLPKVYRDTPPSAASQGGGHHFNGGVGGRMLDSFPPDGRPAGSDLAFMQSQHLDPHHVEYGILTGDGYGVTSMPYHPYAAAISSATNDYTIEHWLSQDSRLKGSINIPRNAPLLAVKEIERVGGRSDMVQVLVSNGARFPYGNEVYDPIYEACVRFNLPFTIHVGGEGAGINSPTTGAGPVAHYIESRAARPQLMMAHLASYIFEGTFEKFPTLQVVLQEAGVFWVVPYLWQLDQSWTENRVQTPWLKKPPSEYFRRHVRITTQPIEATPNRTIFDQVMASMFAQETLMFCSDYPHWDFDSPLQALPRLDEALWDRVYYQNAAELYGLPKRSAEREVKMV